MFARIKEFVLAEGQTPWGKAIEHAAVAGGSVTVSLLVTAAFKGNLDLSGISTAFVAGGTVFLAGLRAYVKKVTQVKAGE